MSGITFIVALTLGLFASLWSQAASAQEVKFKAEPMWGEKSRTGPDEPWPWREDVIVEITFEGLDPKDAKVLTLTLMENKEPAQRDRARSVGKFTSGDRVRVLDPNSTGNYYLARVSYPGGRTALFGKYPNGFIVKVRRL